MNVKKNAKVRQAKASASGQARCRCGRQLLREKNGKLPTHKNPATKQWCAGGKPPKPAATKSRSSAKPTATRSRSDTRSLKAARPAGKAEARKRPRRQWVTCVSCGRSFTAEDGNTLPWHLDDGGARACKGSTKVVSGVKSGRRRSQAENGSTAVSSRGKRPSSDLTPERRREQKRERKRRERIEMAMLELDDRPARDDLEFGPGRDPRVYGGLSQSRRSRY